MRRFLRKYGLWLAALVIMAAGVAAVMLWPGYTADSLIASTGETAAVPLPVTTAAPDERLAAAHAARIRSPG